VDTSLALRVRRAGTRSISPSPYIRRASRPIPISTTSRTAISVLDVVVGCLDGHLDRVRVALPEPRGRDLDELCTVHLRDRGGAGVPHAGPQATAQLVEHLRDVAAVGHPSLDALRYQLLL